MAASPTRDAIVARSLGLPPGFCSNSLLTWEGIGEVTEALQVTAGESLVDVGCGRGSYGIEVARRTGACLVGVDFSSVALEQARSDAARELLAGHARFTIGTLTATDLPTGSASALMCIDAVQFAEPPLAALHEFRRLLVPGGRAVLTCWEAVEASDERVSPRIHAVNLRRDLAAAGFAEIEVYDKQRWRDDERRAWQEVLAAPADPDPAIESLRSEGRRSLDHFDSLRRVLAIATAP